LSRPKTTFLSKGKTTAAPEAATMIEYNRKGRQPGWAAARCASGRSGRKVRTPQSSVPDNVREADVKISLRKCHRKYTAPPSFGALTGVTRIPSDGGVRVKRCGKSAPPLQ
jgi:hypothetical protein